LVASLSTVGRFEIVRGAGHFLPLEATDRVADLAIPFARS
jgi:pimeloyl-ACP methyl ester carboxylesterase